jgi:hypothetical protein
MTWLTKTSLLLVVTVAISACASAQKPELVNPLAPQADMENALDAKLNTLGYASKSPTNRIWNNRFSGWSYVDEQHIIVTFGANKNFLIRFKSRCFDAQQAQTMHFDTVMSSITLGDRVYLESLGRSLRPEQACWIDGLYELERKPREEKKSK